MPQGTAEPASMGDSKGLCMTVGVVVATKGRPDEVSVLLSYLSRQTSRPARVVVVGTDECDLPPAPPRSAGIELDFILSSRPGLTRQRNVGVAHLFEELDLGEANDFVAFFDDDFRPAPDWLTRAAAAFTDSTVAGLTGTVLADGINGAAVSEDEADLFLSGQVGPRPHWSAATADREVESMYGCNMAFRASVVRQCAFDEELALYGWQEDCDYTGQARRLGRTILTPTCRGVHLGTKAARTNGLSFGYSQVSNPIRIYLRRNMTTLRLFRFLGKALLANMVKPLFRPSSTVDYAARRRGNLMALADLLRFKVRPSRITTLNSRTA